MKISFPHPLLGCVFAVQCLAQVATRPVVTAAPSAKAQTQPQAQTRTQTPAAQGSDSSGIPVPAIPATGTVEPPVPNTFVNGTVPGANTPRPGAMAALSAEYRIGPYDTLQVIVWKEQQLSGVFPVRPDGMISLVLLGDISAAGTTPMQLGRNIAEGLKKYIQDPLVTVTVTAVNSQKIYVIGQVGHVGPVELSPGMTPLEAIAAAGGLTTYANGKHSYILRGAVGKQKKIPFNYAKALKGDDSSPIQLETGDTVVVP